MTRVDGPKMVMVVLAIFLAGFAAVVLIAGLADMRWWVIAAGVLLGAIASALGVGATRR